MIRDVDEIRDDEEFRAEIGIVGAGFAGLDLARYLGRHGKRVVLLESGRERFEPEIQELARIESVGKAVRKPDPNGPFTPYLPPIFRGEFRIRQFGGTSNIWTGKWRTFDALDFGERPWIPFSGWPITREDVEPFYREILQDYGLPDLDGFARSEAFMLANERLNRAGLKLSFHYWEETALRPASLFRAELEQSTTVQVMLGANATEIVLAEDLERVEAITFRSLDGRGFTLRADYFVLSTGGLEAARLLLASNRQIPAGIGNANGLVGRFHMDHPKSKRARLWPGPALQFISRWTNPRPRPCFHVSLSLTDRIQQEQRFLNHAIYLRPVYEYQVDYPKESVKRLRQAVRSANPGQAAAAAHELLRSPRSLWKVIQRWRYADLGGPIAYYTVSMYMEQAPNRESALYLGTERDDLGMPRLVVDWQLSPYDHQAFRGVVRGLVAACERAGLGRLDFGPELPTLDDMVDAAHHIGATRMAATPETGVVDANCRVFGTRNLFVASSSVFPTGHSAAPTLTILALARRLGAHLLKLHATIEGRNWVLAAPEGRDPETR